MHRWVPAGTVLATIPSILRTLLIHYTLYYHYLYQILIRKSLSYISSQAWFAQLAVVRCTHIDISMGFLGLC